MITWITGNSGAGKTTLARALQRSRPRSILLDGDAMRAVWPGLTLSYGDRWEQNMRAARLAVLLEDQGFEVIVATICPYRALRAEIYRMTLCKFVYVEGGRSGTDYPYER